MIPGLLAALAVLAPLQAPSPGEPVPRPRDPWVFRSVLDGRARMVTVALHEELWLAYDATTGRLVKAWKGDVDFQGAVYTTEHGPQPASRGRTWFEDPGDGPTFRVLRGGDDVPVREVFIGYRFARGEVRLGRRLELEDGTAIQIEEQPEFGWGRDLAPTLTRRFLVEGLPEDLRCQVRIPAGGFSGCVDGWLTLDGDGWSATEGVVELEPALVEEPVGAARHVGTWRGPEGVVPPGGTTVVPMTLIPPVIDAEIDGAWNHVAPNHISRLVFGDVESETDLGATFRALYDVDCLYVLFEVVDDAVVNDSAQTFNDDAVEVYLDGGGEKQDFYDANDFQYVFGVGDEAFWVTNQPGMHPGVRFASVRTDDGYRVEVALPWANVGVQVAPGLEIGLELHVDDDDDGREMDAAASWHSESTNAWSDASVFATAVLGAPEAGTPRALGPREPGLALRAWSIGRAMARLERLVPGQTPNVSIVVPEVDLDAPEDFGGLTDQFVAELTGWLTVESPGTHAFRLVSDDGSRLWIDNQPVVDNDGLHGPEPAEGALELAAGPHALRIAYFEERAASASRSPGSRPVRRTSSRSRGPRTRRRPARCA